MSLFDKLITERRSIRKFTEKEISSEIEQELLQAAIQVPSATNSRPLRIQSYQSTESRQHLKDLLDKGYDTLQIQGELEKDDRSLKQLRFLRRYALPMLEAPLLWAVSGAYSDRYNLSGMTAKWMRREQISQTNKDLSLGCSLQNVMLKAVELGLGSCIYSAPLGFLSAAEMKDLPATFVAFGYPNENPSAPTQSSPDEIFFRL